MRFVTMALVAPLALCGCLQSSDAPAGSRNDENTNMGDVSAGRSLYERHCLSCHGKAGRGDGPVSKALDVPPADLTALSVVNDGRFPQEEVMAQVYGYPGRHHVQAMPSFGQLLDGPMVPWKDSRGHTVMTPAALLDLVGYIETIQED